MEGVRLSREAPLLLPAAAVALGAVLAFGAPHRPVPAAALLAGCGLALGGPAGVATAGLAAGFLATAVREVGCARSLPLEGRPAGVLVRLVTPWRWESGEWTARAQAIRLRQGRSVQRWSEPVVLSVASRQAPPLAERLRVQGTLRRRSAAGNGGASSPGPWRLRAPHPALVRVDGSGSPWRRWLLGLRSDIARRLDRAGDGGALVRALALGDTGALPDRWLRALRRAGLGHLVAVSGLHVGLVATVAWWLGARWRRIARTTVAAVLVAAYALVAGGRPSVERAAIAALLALAAQLLGRPPAAANSLAGAALGLSLLDPSLWLDTGFRMTVGATAGLLVFTRRLERRWSRVPATLRRPLAATLAAQVGTLAFSLSAHGYLAWAAAPLHLIVLPWTLLVLGAGALVLGVDVVAPGSAAAAASQGLLGSATLLLEGAARLPAGPWWGVPVRAPMPAGALVAAIVASCAMRARAGVGSVCLLALLMVGGAAPEPPAVGVAFLDVGQGDAVLLRQGAEGILVDGGGWPRGDLGGRVLVPALAEAGVASLQALVLTHPDRDHCGGLLDVASYLRVREVWSGPGWEGDDCVARLMALPATRLRVLWRGAARDWGSWRFVVLGPEAGERTPARNERSLVIRAEASGIRVLLTGDIGSATERRLLVERGTLEVAADLLKVAHHGSRKSTETAFLRAVAPRLAVVSAGSGNPYGHPAPELWDRLTRAGVPRLRTDRDGQVRVRFTAVGRLRVDLPGGPGERD